MATVFRYAHDLASIADLLGLELTDAQRHALELLAERDRDLEDQITRLNAAAGI